MRICLIADGSSEHILRLCQFFIGQGHETHLITWKTRADLPQKAIVHILKNFRFPVIKEFAWLLQSRNLVASVRPDIVDGHYVSVYGFIAAFSNFHPLVVTAWGSDILIDPWKNPLSRALVKYSLQRSDKIVSLFPVDNIKEKVRNLGLDSSKIDYYYLGVDTVVFDRIKDTQSYRRKLGISETDFVVLNTRGLAPVYDIRTFVNAIPFVVANNSRTKFIIVYKPCHQSVVDGLKKQPVVANHVIFLGWIPRCEMPMLLSASDIYVSSSLSDGASNALFEAMSCGLVPVITDIPANRHWIKEMENGLFFNPGDYKTLAEKILFLLNHDELRISFGQTCRVIATKFLEQNTQQLKILHIYETLIDSKISAKNREKVF